METDPLKHKGVTKKRPARMEPSVVSRIEAGEDQSSQNQMK